MWGWGHFPSNFFMGTGISRSHPSCDVARATTACKRVCKYPEPEKRPVCSMRLTTTRDRNLQFRGARLHWICLNFSSGFFLRMWRKLPDFREEKKRRILSRLWLSWLFGPHSSLQDRKSENPTNAVPTRTNFWECSGNFLGKCYDACFLRVLHPAVQPMWNYT